MSSNHASDLSGSKAKPLFNEEDTIDRRHSPLPVAKDENMRQEKRRWLLQLQKQRQRSGEESTLSACQCSVQIAVILSHGILCSDSKFKQRRRSVKIISILPLVFLKKTGKEIPESVFYPSSTYHPLLYCPAHAALPTTKLLVHPSLPICRC